MTSKPFTPHMFQATLLENTMTGGTSIYCGHCGLQDTSPIHNVASDSEPVFDTMPPASQQGNASEKHKGVQSPNSGTIPYCLNCGLDMTDEIHQLETYERAMLTARLLVLQSRSYFAWLELSVAGSDSEHSPVLLIVTPEEFARVQELGVEVVVVSERPSVEV